MFEKIRVIRSGKSDRPLSLCPINADERSLYNGGNLHNILEPRQKPFDGFEITSTDFPVVTLDAIVRRLDLYAIRGGRYDFDDYTTREYQEEDQSILEITFPETLTAWGKNDGKDVSRISVAQITQGILMLIDGDGNPDEVDDESRERPEYPSFMVRKGLQGGRVVPVSEVGDELTAETLEQYLQKNPDIGGFFLILNSPSFPEFNFAQWAFHGLADNSPLNPEPIIDKSGEMYAMVFDSDEADSVDSEVAAIFARFLLLMQKHQLVLSSKFDEE